ncbi:hypothetical protein [Streptomyces qinglanensis]|uniref:hypothetical protein n=1 Tax=Streptomyces qinglanensis TaxID=943816 RepID=UPI003D75D65C
MGIPTPSGCQHCGVEQRSHARRWTEAAGWHPWTAPTQEQMKARMRARRAKVASFFGGARRRRSGTAEGGER